MIKTLGIITLCTLAFAAINSSDRNPLQWPSAFLCGASLFVFLLALGQRSIVAFIGWIEKTAKRRQRQ